ncbi:hypothetical protein MKX03_029026 [Papaver bracteatum]|nr:hypothetical protein MKX03_029026 [Papaver bracteatum]
MDSNTIGTYGVLARPLAHIQTAHLISLASRLQSNGSYSECWDSLTELQACTREVILFFLNTIHIIQHNCWPAMLGSLGFTQEEGDILPGYCDATTNVLPPPSSMVVLVNDDLNP